MKIVFSKIIKNKLDDKHKVKESEVSECFANFNGVLLQDSREEHKTNPATQWFIGETDHGRILKICFVLDNGSVYIKTAYEPNSREISIYNKHNNG